MGSRGTPSDRRTADGSAHWDVHSGIQPDAHRVVVQIGALGGKKEMGSVGRHRVRRCGSQECSLGCNRAAVLGIVVPASGTTGGERAVGDDAERDTPLTSGGAAT